ncbi:oxygen-insensitive NAD(P)H nitroreductase [Marichromatium bheemlicum]|uniref:Oxygen-insensitive NAD(P)H nitroreductase n=1 Tax=Marichromatium bheemlicum TaxID=365339 RepID=A0ABX1I9U1_9GAMM|nr:oxygen-insensitive NAD(P)H nitroreductase [Marichromatium bheemlicum]NKN34292.1 oxygen-insensitive NAD(P)H nitroreductase [Marichromatium bheemlicum]
MNIADYAQTRHAAKAFDASRRIPEAEIKALRALLRHAPSSVNSQPWHFVIAATEAGKARVSRSTEAGHTYNTPKIVDASHVIVLCARTEIDEAHLERLLAQERADGRFVDAEAEARQRATRGFYVGLHRDELGDLDHWAEKQVYLALGSLLLGAATLGLDACPIEGFDRAVLDTELGLREQGLSAVVLVALGYRAEADFNAGLPKSRLPEQTLFSEL